MEALYEVPCIFLESVSIPLDKIGRGLISSYVVVSGKTDDRFRGSGAGSRLGHRFPKYACRMRGAADSYRPGRL